MEYNKLKFLIDKKLSSREIAEELKCSQTNIIYWLNKYKLKTCNTVKKRSLEQIRKDRIKYVQKRRLKIKKLAVEYKGGKCSICGYNNYVGALEFHHIDKTTKEFGIGQYGNSRSWERVKKELDKCILVCSNCHREIHANIIKIGV